MEITDVFLPVIALLCILYVFIHFDAAYVKKEIGHA